MKIVYVRIPEVFNKKLEAFAQKETKKLGYFVSKSDIIRKAIKELLKIKE